MNIENIIAKSRKFEEEAHIILGKHENAKASRVILLRQTYDQLQHLSTKQNELLTQAIQCVECELYRSAIVMSWAGLIDVVEEFAVANINSIKVCREKWKVESIHDLREGYPEAQLIDAMKDAKLITKGEWKALHGLLSRRNECAHPSDYSPGLNEALGFISEILNRLERFHERDKVQETSRGV